MMERRAHRSAWGALFATAALLACTPEFEASKSAGRRTHDGGASHVDGGANAGSPATSGAGGASGAGGVTAISGNGGDDSLSDAGRATIDGGFGCPANHSD